MGQDGRCSRFLVDMVSHIYRGLVLRVDLLELLYSWVRQVAERPTPWRFYAKGLIGDPSGMLKIDCGEFVTATRLPNLWVVLRGILGHRETPPLLTQKRIDALQKEGMPLSIILFDEIEKASDSLWQLLLGVLDKATLTSRR